MEIVFIQAVEAFGVKWLVTCTAKWLTRIWFMAWPTAIDEKPLHMYQEKYPDRKGPCFSFFVTLNYRLCQTGSFDAHKLDVGRNKQFGQFFAEDSAFQELKCNPSTSTRVVSRETHKTPTYRLVDCTGRWIASFSFTMPFISIRRHRQTKTSAWNLRGDFCKKM